MKKVYSGIDVLKSEKYLSLLKGKRIGLITNPTGVDSNLNSTVDVLDGMCNLKILFAPEHGVRGNLQAGVKTENYTDSETGLPVYSLYSGVLHIKKEQMSELDAIVFDIQDVGARFYTYMYTLSYVMEDCAKFGKEIFVLDRVNPIGGISPEGTILDRRFSSFVGRFPIATRYNMTIGEFALYINDTENIYAHLTIIPLEGWKRDMYFDECELDFVLPSPNIPTVDTCFCYIGTCLAEGTNLSEGRGTTKPFEMIGAPFIDGRKLADKMNSFSLPGVRFKPCYFTPSFSKHSGELCEGVSIHIRDRKEFLPFESGLRLIDTIRQAFPEFKLREERDKDGRLFMDKLLGSDAFEQQDFDVDKFLKSTETPLLDYKEKIKNYYIY